VNITELEAFIRADVCSLKVVFPWDDPNEGMMDQGTSFFFKLYDLNENGTVNDKAYFVVVIDRDGPTEAVYFKKEFPACLQETPFKDALIAEIEAFKQLNPSIKVIQTGTINETLKFGILTAYILVNNKIESKNYFAWDENGTIEKKEFATPEV